MRVVSGIKVAAATHESSQAAPVGRSAPAKPSESMALAMVAR